MSGQFHIQPDGSWTYDGEDSQLRDKRRNQVTWRIWNPFTEQFEWKTMNPTYCRNCGVHTGYTNRECAYIVDFCNPCFNSSSVQAEISTGKLIPQLPDEEWRWRNGLPPPED
jgi:hypothetical protein